MKIKRIEIVGFKSFVDKVALDFQEGVTGIVGPNGCGKSNVVDAIRWAMGEQSAKNLRGRSMEDVIFGGSETRKPHGMAEVTMVFANDDGLGPPAFREYTEIMVTRRLYRNGDSEYLLNKTPCRLLDISELFMDTGVGKRAYSIIEQGKIGMKTASRKIDATKQNLLRLSDIISEVRRQLGSLKRQAQRAERFRQFREELKGIETVFARQRLAELQQGLDDSAAHERQLAGQLQQRQLELEAQELRHDELKLQQVTAEKEVAASQEQVYQLGAQIQQVEGKLEFGSRERASLDLQLERLVTEQREVSGRLGDLDGQEQTLQTGSAQLAFELAEANRVLAEAEAALQSLSEAEGDAAGRQEQLRGELFALMNELTRLHNLQEDARRRLELLDERTTRNRQEAVGLQEQQQELSIQSEQLAGVLASSRRQRDELRDEQQAARDRLGSLRQALEENEVELLQRREELNRCRSRLESLQQLERDLEGYSGGVKAVLQSPELATGFRGMAADLLEVPAEFEVAVEAVLGERLQALLCSSAASARNAIDFLRSKGGRSTFVIDLPQAEIPAWPGGIPLGERIGFSADAAPLRALLTGVYLVDDLEPATGQGLPWGVTLVTASGEVLTSRGELSGGSSQSLGEGLLHKKREMKELGGKLSSCEAAVSGLQLEREKLQQELRQTETLLQELATELHAQELRLANSDKDFQRLQQEQQRFAERIEVLGLEGEQLHEEQSGLQQRHREALEGRRSLEEQRLAAEQQLEEVQQQLQSQRQAVSAARDELTGLKVQVASLREREESDRRSREGLERLRQELKGRLALVAGQQEEARRRQETIAADETRLRTELEVLYTRREELRQRYDRQRDGFEELSARLAAQDESLRGLRQGVAGLRDQLAGLQLGSREKELEVEHLCQSFFDKYRIELKEQPAEPPPGFSTDVARRRQDELRRQIEAIGEVNLTAIEEYQELEERHTFLTTQQEDLRRSLQGLQEAIAKINRTTRKRFRETFDQVNSKFQEVFPRLFRGGRAELKLTDEEDLLETGIDIIAQPPGKKLQNVSLLSGGEKALTAVALIFSIFMIKPSPFCLLDEVDAPLDDANIGRFNEMVTEMSAISQFIIITHNKRTMEIADPLYGVTMEEPGVSKLVSVRIGEY